MYAHMHMAVRADVWGKKNHFLKALLALNWGD